MANHRADHITAYVPLVMAVHYVRFHPAEPLGWAALALTVAVNSIVFWPWSGGTSKRC